MRGVRTCLGSPTRATHNNEVAETKGARFESFRGLIQVPVEGCYQIRKRFSNIPVVTFYPRLWMLFASFLIEFFSWAFLFPRTCCIHPLHGEKGGWGGGGDGELFKGLGTRRIHIAEYNARLHKAAQRSHARPRLLRSLRDACSLQRIADGH
jgi:hypothetical protein